MIVGTKNYVEYVFRAFGAIAILVIEMTPKFDQRLETIAQVINECDSEPFVSGLHFVSF